MAELPRNPREHNSLPGTSAYRRLPVRARSSPKMHSQTGAAESMAPVAASELDHGATLCAPPSLARPFSLYPCLIHYIYELTHVLWITANKFNFRHFSSPLLIWLPFSISIKFFMLFDRSLNKFVPIFFIFTFFYLF